MRNRQRGQSEQGHRGLGDQSRHHQCRVDRSDEHRDRDQHREAQGKSPTLRPGELETLGMPINYNNVSCKKTKVKYWLI